MEKEEKGRGREAGREQDREGRKTGKIRKERPRGRMN
jgi:hypothetical protein